MYFWWIIIAFSFFLEDEVLFLIPSLSSLTLLKVGPKNPFTTLPLPFFFFLLSSFLKSDFTFLNKSVYFLILSLYIYCELILSLVFNI